MKKWLSSLTPLLVFMTSFALAAAVLHPLLDIQFLSYSMAIGFAVAVTWLVSPYARLSIARRSGRVYEALCRADAMEGDARYSEPLKILRAVVPHHAARGLLIRAHQTLWNLEVFARYAGYEGVPEAVTRSIVQEARGARNALWRCVERVTALSSGDTRLAELLASEAENLAPLVDGIKEARIGLADLTILALRGERDEGKYRDIAERELAPLMDAARQLDAQIPTPAPPHGAGRDARSPQ